MVQSSSLLWFTGASKRLTNYSLHWDGTLRQYPNGLALDGKLRTGGTARITSDFAKRFDTSTVWNLCQCLLVQKNK